MKKSFYFKTDKLLGFTSDDETGELTEAYVKVDVPIDIPPSNPDDAEAYEGVKRFVAETIGVNPDLLYIISAEEYEENTDRDEQP